MTMHYNTCHPDTSSDACSMPGSGLYKRDQEYKFKTAECSCLKQ